ncbi:programmed cell death protein 2-like isoform X3 [Peromyscus californicus insignis]|uniref:programmed cell death protein 2-like isoform X3 n=1 Tax=Peromyscus californicus insignis TaxID=564181 RepID=UPI0022A7C93E|nr:programmed cell death protein 2-like isoform X3 [Peromyscus californicus insignis]
MAAVRKPVLLGLRDAAVQGCPKGPAAWTASKLGGVPDALPAVTAPGPRCGGCAEPLALVVQVYCPLEGSPFHRLLHVFACARPGCGGGGSGTRSWKVFRSQCLQVPEKETLNAQDSAPAVAHPVPSGEGLAVHAEVPQFQPYYICVAEEEDYGNSVDLEHARSLLQDYQQREGVDMEHLLSLCSYSDGDEKYEKTNIKSGDQTFYKFMKRIAACQEQILRYSWSGEPLFLVCPTSEVSEIPACSGCGGQRTFEFQLMPALVSMLSSANLGLAVEFGTILVYTCEQSCWPPNQQTPMEEFCIIQEDPDEFLFK